MLLRLAAALLLLAPAPALAQGVKISDLPAASALGGSEKIPAAQSGNTVAVTPTQIVTFAGATFQPLDSDLTALAALTTTSTGRNLLTAANAAAIRSQAGVVIGTDVQAFHANLSQLAGLSLVADRLPYANGTGTLALATFTTAGRALVDDADASAQRTTLGVTATGADTTYAYRANNLSDLASASTSRTNLGVAIGTNVQAWDADLDTLSSATTGAWSTWSPTVSASTPAGSGFAATVEQARYSKVGRIVSVQARVLVTNLGTGPSASGNLTVTLPTTAAAHALAFGFESTNTGKGMTGRIDSGTNLATFRFTDNTTTMALNSRYWFSVTYESDS